MLIKMTQEQLDAHTAEMVAKAIEAHGRKSTGGMTFMFGGGAKTATKGYDLETPMGRALAWSRSLRALGIANGNQELAAEIAKGWLEHRKYESDEAVVAVLKSNALNPSVLTEGGIFITPDHYSDMIMLLMANTVIEKMKGVEHVPMTSGTELVDFELTAPTAEWIGENQEQNATEATYGQHLMIAKTVMATSAVKNNLLDRADAGTKVDAIILDSIRKQITNAVDVAFLTGTGSAYAPTGILTYTSPANKFGTTGTTTSQVKADISNLVDLVEGADVNIENGNYIMNNHNATFLGNVSTTTDFPIYPELKNNPKELNGYAAHITSNMPSGTIMFVDSSKILVGDTKALEINASREASYMRGGTLVSAFSRRETVFQVQMQTDMFLKYAKAASAMTGVSY